MACPRPGVGWSPCTDRLTTRMACSTKRLAKLVHRRGDGLSSPWGGVVLSSPWGGRPASVALGVVWRPHRWPDDVVISHIVASTFF